MTLQDLIERHVRFDLFEIQLCNNNLILSVNKINSKNDMILTIVDLMTLQDLIERHIRFDLSEIQL